jgi:hypothetical protein
MKTRNHLSLTSNELLNVYIERHPENTSMAAEYVQLGLADHPDFLRLMETSISESADSGAIDKAKQVADRLLKNARDFSTRPNTGVIDGRRCGVQSCGGKDVEANVYAEFNGRLFYVRLDRGAKMAIKPTFEGNPAYAFAQEHFEAFEQICLKAEAGIPSPKKQSKPSLAM